MRCQRLHYHEMIGFAEEWSAQPRVLTSARRTHCGFLNPTASVIGIGRASHFEPAEGQLGPDLFRAAPYSREGSEAVIQEAYSRRTFKARGTQWEHWGQSSVVFDRAQQAICGRAAKGIKVDILCDVVRSVLGLINECAEARTNASCLPDATAMTRTPFHLAN